MRSGRVLQLAASALLAFAGCAAGQEAGGALEAPWDDWSPYQAGLAREWRELPEELRRASQYHLELSLSEDLSEVEGSLRILYTNREGRDIQKVALFLFPNLLPGALALRSVSADGLPVEPSYPRGPHLASLSLPASLSPGARVELSLEYTMKVPSGTDGVYGGLARNPGVLSLASACPVIPAVRAWDQEPPVPYGDFLAGEAAFFLANVTLPAGWELAAPGSLKVRRAAGGGTRATVALGPARDLYLAAVQGYSRRERREGAVTVVSLASRGGEPGAELAAEAAALSLRSCQRRFGPYPYSRLTFVAAPFGSFGLEFPGIVLLASRLYDLAGSEGGLPNRVLLESTVAHETAHQWFYGLVGSDPQEEPWLDEAPAQYAAWLYYRDRYGEAPAEGYFSSFDARWARVGRQPVPIGLPVRAYSPAEYGAIVSGRGPLFLAALSQRMGEAAFDRLLAEYARRWAWRMAAARDFLALAEEVCGCPLGELVRDWGVLSSPEGRR